MTIWQMLAAIGLPSAIMGLIVWKLESRIAKHEKEIEARQAAQEELLMLIVQSNGEKMLAMVKGKGFPGMMVRGADGLYRVQVGAYGVQRNAQAMAAKLKNAGFSVVVV